MIAVATRPVRFDFYRIVEEGTERARPLGAILERTLPGNHRPVLHRDKYVRLEEFHRAGQVHVGVASLISMQNLPNLADIDRPGVVPLGRNIRDTEGIAGLTAFLYSEPYDVIVLQRNHQGPREGAFVRLLNTLTNEGPFRLLPIFERDLITKLRRMRLLREIQVKVANPTAPEAYKEVTLRTSAMLARRFEGRQVSIRVNIGPGRGQLNADAVHAEAEGILSVTSDYDPIVKGLKVKGKQDYEDESYTWLDLLNERLTAEVEVPLRIRGFTPDSLLRAVRQAYEQRLDDLGYYRAV